MTTTFRIPVAVLAFAASLATTASLVATTSVPSDIPTTESAAADRADPHACGRAVADAFPTAEAQFAMRRQIAVRT